MIHSPAQIMEQLLHQDRLWLFLDYDGTLADFAPTPEHVVADPEVISIVSRLVLCPRVRVAVISGRPLDQIRQLLPRSHIWLAGTYGVEVQTPSGEILRRAEWEVIRPALEQLKPFWQQLIADRTGFLLEDKGWALALHARFANDAEAAQVLWAAATSTVTLVSSGEFRLLHSQHFLEICPILAHKGRAVDYVLDRFAWPGGLPVYLGDDDNDEDAFEVIKARHGVAVLVAAIARTTLADTQLDSPQAARDWLNQLTERLSVNEPL